MKRRQGVGSTIGKISVIRRDGSTEVVAENIHNIIANSLASASGRTNYGGSSYLVYLYGSRIRRQSTSTWSQSGYTLTRESGSDTLIYGRIVQFPDGDWSYISNSNISSSGLVSNSMEKSESVVYEINSETSYGTDSIRSKSFNVKSTSYSNGVITSASTGSMVFDPVSSQETIRRIAICSAVSSAFADVCYFDLPNDVVLEIGDSLVIDNFELNITFDEYEPRELEDSPISGVATSCRAQRLLPTRGTQSEESQIPNRIWLIEDGNEYALPDLRESTLNPNVLTPVETIVATGSWSSSTPSNNMTRSNSCYGLVSVGSSQVKQIAWGTTSYIFGILEFDTPQNIPQGKVITIGGNQKFKIDVPIP